MIRMRNILQFILFWGFVTLTTAELDKNKFPLCKLCKCNFNANDTAADVMCKELLPYDHIFQDYFWKLNNTNESIAYNSLVINNNNFNNLTELFPKSNLTLLNLAENNIVIIKDSVFRNLQNMVVLILSHNDLETIHPDTFKGLYLEERLLPLRSLRELRLDHNKLHTLHQDTFEHTTDIEILDLSYNDFDIIDHPTLFAICSLASLKELYLQYTGLKTLPDNMLHTLRKLQVLDLSGNMEISKMPTTLEQAINLQKLYLNNTGFVNLTRENGFPDLPSLKVLHLCRNEHLHHIDKYALSGLTNLSDLRICDNIDLSSIHELALPKPSNVSGGAVWPPIKKLYIGNNKLAYLESELVARWDSLSELDIRENPLTCECENQWLVEDLMPIYLKINEEMAKEVRCAAPIEMKAYTLYDIYMKKSHMRCLDVYGNRPEKDGVMLVAVLAGKNRFSEEKIDEDYYDRACDTNGECSLSIGRASGILIVIPLILMVMYAYQRKWFSVLGFCDRSPASYSRRFYNSTRNDDF
ncbi:unnamed protein product [Phyllotreta striolata]|uniref:Uncharacterized protein n=1 Tax=Phyllotreta striolata TaxID=444603 RepID=A0A9N9TVB0_PHYSR|nr:unnamed protein product [Phyllotreta striolata]